MLARTTSFFLEIVKAIIDIINEHLMMFIESSKTYISCCLLMRCESLDRFILFFFVDEVQ